MKMWEWVIGVNLWGVVYGVKVFLFYLFEYGDGYVVNTALMVGYLFGWLFYMVFKFAVVGLMEGFYF